MPLLLQNVVIDDRSPIDIARDFLGVTEVSEAIVVRRSLDARARAPTWRGNLRVVVANEAALLARAIPGVRAWTARDEQRRSGVLPVRRASWASRPIVVGAGPAGLFAALRLAEAGAPVLLLERGDPTEARVKRVSQSWRQGNLDPESNLLFGEGGAGTFSDGKVYTRRRDGSLGYIFRALVDAGADASILEESYAHIGTDRLRRLLPVLRQRLLDQGGEVRFRARVTDLVVHGGRCVGVRLATGEEVLGGPVIVAAGHSARDTVAMMLRAGAVAEPRPIAIGARVEHPQALVDAALYPAGRGELPASSYRLAHNPAGGRSAYTFCMCPGGMVVPAHHEPGTVVVNGMSFSGRGSLWANSAVIAQVPVADYGAADPLAGQRYQAAIERAAHALSGSNAAPAQRVADFIAGRPSPQIQRTSFPFGVVPAELDRLLPPPVVASMRQALLAFDAKLPGFASNDGVLLAPETRTTSPVRFLRGPDHHSVSLPGLIPAGEGAGWGGGIVSAAHDGLSVAESVIAGA